MVGVATAQVPSSRPPHVCCKMQSKHELSFRRRRERRHSLCVQQGLLSTGASPRARPQKISKPAQHSLGRIKFHTEYFVVHSGNFRRPLHTVAFVVTARSCSMHKRHDKCTTRCQHILFTCHQPPGGLRVSAGSALSCVRQRSTSLRTINFNLQTLGSRPLLLHARLSYAHALLWRQAHASERHRSERRRWGHRRHEKARNLQI